MKSTVLLVDDAAIARRLLRHTFEHAGFDVVEAENGLDALERLAADPHIGLLVCDVNMPRMGGLDLLDVLREDPRWNKLPVIFLTVDGQADLIARARWSGAKAWLIKPFNPERLLGLATGLIVGREVAREAV
jgi:two-component system chemotaxis response regulator CheY